MEENKELEVVNNETTQEINETEVDNQELELINTEETSTSEVENVQENSNNETSGQEPQKLQEEEKISLTQAELQDRIDNSVKGRLAREKRNIEKENADLYEIEGILKNVLGAKDRKDVKEKLINFYQEQGINIPQYKPMYNEREEKILAEAEAKEIIDLGIYEMEKEANRIAAIPLEERTNREKIIFSSVCQELVNKKQAEELRKIGLKPDILEDKNFKSFKDQFNVSTPINKIYEMYTKIQGKSVEQPQSTGSVKTSDSTFAHGFTQEKLDNMTPQEMEKFWDDPAFRKIAGLN